MRIDCELQRAWQNWLTMNREQHAQNYHPLSIEIFVFDKKYLTVQRNLQNPND